MDLSIVIVNWNAKNYLQDCLNSIIDNSSGLNIEIIVVDNASTDKSVETIKIYFPQTVLIENHDNRGFGAANNQGIKISKAEYVLLLNPDTIVLPDALTNMVKFMETERDAGIVGCKILETDGTINTSVRKFPTLFTEITHLISTKKKNSTELSQERFDYNKTCEVDSLSGCCLLIRKESIRNIGYFDEEYFMYADDIDVCYRMKKSNFKVFYFSDAQVVHHGGKSSEQAGFRTSVESFKSIRKYFKKHHNLAKYLLFNILASAVYFLKVIIYSLFYLFAKDKCLIKNKLSIYSSIFVYSIIGKEIGCIRNV